MAGGIARGEIRLVRFPTPDKARPALELTRASAIPYLSRIIVAPITSSIRGVPSEVAVGPEDGMKQPGWFQVVDKRPPPREQAGVFFAGNRLADEVWQGTASSK